MTKNYISFHWMVLRSFKLKVLFILFFICHKVSQSQSVVEQTIDLSVGFGLSTSYYDDNVVEDGIFFQGEYVMTFNSWFQLRPYLGAVITNAGNEDLDGNPTDVRATTKAALLGGKVRLSIPIPWIAPYIEAGIGASIGAFETVSPPILIDKSGVIYHIPVAFGLQLGKRRQIDLGLSYFFQPNVEQYAGALAIGISIPIRPK